MVCCLQYDCNNEYLLIDVLLHCVKVLLVTSSFPPVVVVSVEMFRTVYSVAPLNGSDAFIVVAENSTSSGILMNGEPLTANWTRVPGSSMVIANVQAPGGYARLEDCCGAAFGVYVVINNSDDVNQSSGCQSMYAADIAPTYNQVIS